MIERYQTKTMKNLWSDQNKYEKWLRVEIVAAKAWSILGHIPSEDVDRLNKNASFDIQRIQEIELETRHDVVAFTRAVSESLGEERKWVHYGLTSTDVVDTAQALILKEVNQELLINMNDLIQTLENLAIKHKYTVMMGRTHGIHAEPTTFGLTLALWLQEMKRNRKRFMEACQDIEVGKISGAVGTHANIPLFVEEYVCQNLGIGYAEISTQVLQRDRHANYLSVIALCATSIEKIAVNIRHLQRTEVQEVEESFGNKQTGSSAMPHKKNPIGSENISGIARVIRGYTIPGFENMPLWHERDISHSSAERIILSDATSLLSFILIRMNKLLSNLIVNKERMLSNIYLTNGVIFSQQVLLKLIEKGLSREDAYTIVQKLALESWNERVSFYDLLVKSKEVNEKLSLEEIDNCFDLNYHLKSIDELFNRIGL